MTVKLSCVGDIVVTRPLAKALAKPGTAAAIARLAAADCVIGNLEIPLCTSGAPVAKLVTHRASPERAAELAGLGFDVLVMANNHAMDYGVEGFLETIDHLRKSGIVPLGAGRNLTEALQAHVVHRGDVSVAIVAVSALLPAGSEAGPERPGIAPMHVYTAFEADANILMEQPGTAPQVRTRVDERDLEALCSLIQRLKAEHNYVVCYVHWGVGMQQRRAEYQTALGPALAKAGADLVVGCHPHTIQEIEHHGASVVFYNLGEFFSQYADGTIPDDLLADWGQIQPEGYILEAEFNARRCQVRLVPVTLDSDGDPSLDGADHVAAKICRMCKVPHQVGADGAIELLPANES